MPSDWCANLYLPHHLDVNDPSAAPKEVPIGFKQHQRLFSNKLNKMIPFL